MNIRDRLSEDLKAAMRAKDSVRLETIRGVRGAIRQVEVDTGKELGESAILELVRRLRKQRLESIEQYAAGGRDDLVQRETREKEILEEYLPAAPDAATVERVVDELISALEAPSIRDMGSIMQAARQRLPGVDGKALSSQVKAKLA